MSEAVYHIGVVKEVLASLEDNSVDLVLTSPPFLALRSYLPADHPDKHKEIGSEPTPAAFLDTLLALTAEWCRVLTPYGSLCVELGDTYAGTAMSGQRYDEWNGLPEPYGGRGRSKGGNGWPLDKSLCIIPELYAACLAYGRNVLTGEPSPAGQLRVRNLVRWVRPNPPVGALGDKFRPATSVMTVAAMSRDRWFDLDDVRTEHTTPDSRADKKYPRQMRGRVGTDGENNPSSSANNPAGAPPLDWWNIPTEPYRGSHYATWPRKLCERPIRSMCPREVCTTCGEPRRRMVAVQKHGAQDNKGRNGRKVADVERSSTTLGWSTCDCPNPTYRRGIVLDPFAGSGTTLAVATGLGRDAIGIDLDSRNSQLARERVGMFLTVHGDEEPSAVKLVQPSVGGPVAGHTNDDQIVEGVCVPQHSEESDR